MITTSLRFLVERAQRVSQEAIGHQQKNSAWIGGKFHSAWQLNFRSIMEDSIRIYPHLQDTGGFFVAVLQHKRSATAPKYTHISFGTHTLNILH
jgi:hypothetical protein